MSHAPKFNWDTKRGEKKTKLKTLCRITLWCTTQSLLQFSTRLIQSLFCFLFFFSSCTTISDLVPHPNRNMMPAGAGFKKSLAVSFSSAILRASIWFLSQHYSVHYLIGNDCSLFSSIYCYCIMVAHFIMHININCILYTFLYTCFYY